MRMEQPNRVVGQKLSTSLGPAEDDMLLLVQVSLLSLTGNSLALGNLASYRLKSSRHSHVSRKANQQNGLQNVLLRGGVAVLILIPRRAVSPETVGKVSQVDTPHNITPSRNDTYKLGTHLAQVSQVDQLES